MQINRFSITRKYEIKCKAFLPENEEPKHVIIGVHGFAGDKDSSMLKRLANTVCKSGGALICFDFPSHGESPVGEDMLTIENCKRDLLAVVEYTEGKYPKAQKSIFATSFGGYIALKCASHLCDFSLVLRAPAVTMPKILLETVLKISDEEFQRLGVVECGFERKMRLPYSFSRDLWKEESVYDITLSLPTLIIHGDCDDIVPPADVLDFVKDRENVRLEMIPGADHRFKGRGEMEKVIELTKSFLNI